MKVTKFALLALMVTLLGGVLSSPAGAANLPTLKMLSTTTCPACAMMEPVLKDLADKYKGKVATEHVYLEDHPDVAKQYNVRYVPTLIFIDEKGNEVAQEVGYRSLDEVLAVFAQSGVKIK
ncbi:MAG: thioredoxin family protein [Fretibacterium sp.]|nr:thioredoxin family protein [Fretibacterium sp.]